MQWISEPGFWVALVSAVVTGYLLSKWRQRGHRPTDPSCVHHLPPLTPLGRWWFDRHRGMVCTRCRD